MKQRMFFRLIFAGAAVSALASCQEFFTTSLASSLARDQSSLVKNVTTSNLDEYVALSKNNPELALAVLEEIDKAAASAGGSDLIEYQLAAVDVAGTSSEIGSSFLQVASDFLADPDGDILSSLDSTLDGLSQLSESAAALLSILPDPADTAAYDAFVAAASPEQMAMAAVVLILNEAAASTDLAVDYFASIGSSSAETLAKALAESAAANVTAGSQLAEILDKLNLTTP